MFNSYKAQRERAESAEARLAEAEKALRAVNEWALKTFGKSYEQALSEARAALTPSAEGETK